MDTQELSDRLKSMLNPWQIRGMEILQSQVDHQAEALRKHRNASREFMDKLDHEERTEYYVDSDDEVVMYNKRPQHTLNDSYYDSDSPEEQPRKDKFSIQLLWQHQNDNRKLHLLDEAIAMSMQIVLQLIFII
jgi:hypothetical protein